MKKEIDKNNQEDLKWIRKARKGNQKAFEKLILKYQKKFYFIIRKITMNHEDTDDILQDTFVKAYTNLDRFDEQYSFFSWLYRIALNTTINHQKKKNRYQKTFNSPDDDSSDPFPAPGGNPLNNLMEHELQQKISRALECLPVEQRAVFLLRTSENLSYQEISRQLDISIGTVMSRLSRAREKLKEKLQPYLSNIYQ